MTLKKFREEMDRQDHTARHTARALRERGDIPDAMLRLIAAARAVPKGDPLTFVIPPRVDVAGWSFLLDIGKYDEIYARDPVAAQAMLCGVLGMPLGAVDCISAAKPMPTCGRDHEHWLFSACLQPRGRSSCPDDWQNLGMATTLIGVTEEAARASSAQISSDAWVNAGRPIYYAWSMPMPKTPLRAV